MFHKSTVDRLISAYKAGILTKEDMNRTCLALDVVRHIEKHGSITKKELRNYR